MNETLCRALHVARLSEEDVAARLEVDPKTVRRWMEGRLPYLRHRWALVTMLGVDEVDLWPQLRSARSRPGEVRAVYPRRDAVPHEMWLRLFGSATREIGILDHSGLFLAEQPDILATLDERAKAGARVRICLADPDAHKPPAETQRGRADAALTSRTAAALALYAPLRQNATAEIRVHQAGLYNSLYRGDDQLLVNQHIYGIPSGQAPVLHLQGSATSDMLGAYLESFEHIWASARAVD